MSADGWRWVYYFDAIVFALSGLLIAIMYRPPPTKLRREMSTMAEIMSVDAVGAGLLLCGIICIVTSLTWGGNAYAWNSSHVIATLVVGIVILICFVCYGTFEPADTRHPLIESFRDIRPEGRPP